MPYKDPEQKKENEIRRQRKNPTYMRNKSKEWRTKNPNYYKEWRKKHPHYMKNYFLSNPDRHFKSLSRSMFRAALLSGRVIPRTVCEKCEITKKIEAHHPDYTKPLEVIWLCNAHHKIEHRKY